MFFCSFSLRVGKNFITCLCWDTTFCTAEHLYFPFNLVPLLCRKVSPQQEIRDLLSEKKQSIICFLLFIITWPLQWWMLRLGFWSVQKIDCHHLCVFLSYVYICLAFCLLCRILAIMTINSEVNAATVLSLYI